MSETVKSINVAQTLKAFFFPATPSAEVLQELKKLTVEDKKELIEGIAKIGGQIYYTK